MNRCVILPTYNNARTLADAVEAARAIAPVIVVNDGSTDETAAILRGIESITIETHARNRGKGAALRSGFDRARRDGFTHAVTLDTDGQHPAAMAERLFEDALVIGSRDLSSAGLGSRFGRANSNFWTWLETGLRLPDTQSGMRCYPLERIAELRLVTTGYDLEIEVLVKANWAGIPIRSVPVDVIYPKDRVSHMRPILDFVRIGRLNVRLLLLRLCLPAPYLDLVVRKKFYALPIAQRFRESFVDLFLREPGPPRRVALSVALGLFMGLAPIWGFQIAVTLLVAHLTGLSKPTAVVASHISIPLFIPAILYASLVIGRTALGVHAGPITTVELTPTDFPAWVVGSLLLASAAAIVGGTFTYLFLRCVRGLPSSR
ncbi:MAG: DUF2062 domain-containing protein [Planctomycetota bacterium]